jgi:adenosylmethionine-8-amino-7-oxononanoate aminotransferase
VEDRASKVPFDPGRGLAGRVKRAAFEAGLVCYPMSGTIDGRRGDHVLLAPPFVIAESEVDEIVDKLGVALDRALAA